MNWWTVLTVVEGVDGLGTVVSVALLAVEVALVCRASAWTECHIFFIDKYYNCCRYFTNKYLYLFY
jgi:hypothetical protein